MDVVNSFVIISDIALVFIAFIIGCEFKISYFKHVGAAPIVIAIFAALAAVFIIQGILIAVGYDFAFSLVLGSIAAATAPAATIMVVKQYKAKGPVTEMLLSVVALDDAVALIAFGFAVTIAKTMSKGLETSFIVSIINPINEIMLAIIIGGIVGLIFKIPLKYFKKSSNRVIIMSGMILLSGGLAQLYGVSQLLACMMTGAVFCNISHESSEILRLSDYITPPIFLLFFAVSGAQLDITIIPTIGAVGIIYVIFRIVGKIVGAYLGAKLMKAPETVSKYLGFTLIPQAGVAIGLISIAETELPQYASTIRAVVLCATVIYEIIGPIMTKVALVKAGEIKEK